MFSNVRTVAIDDQENELKSVLSGLNRAKISCMPVKYDELTGISGSISEPLKGVRFVFTDINLTETPGTNEEVICSTFAAMMESLLSIDNGPYALIFWSRNDGFGEKIISFLSERHADTVPAPSVWAALQKPQYGLPSSMEDSGIDEVVISQENIESLKEDIVGIAKKCPKFYALINWEENIFKASNETINSLYALINTDNSWELDKTSDHLGRLITSIAQEAVGPKNLNENVGRGFNEGLSPILTDKLASLFGQEPDEVLEDVLIAGAGRIDPPEQVKPSSLNSFYHIDQVGNLNQYDRGVYSCLDLSDDVRIKSVFNAGKKELMAEFLNMEGVGAEKKEEVRSSVKLGVIEISPACDYAQNKNRTRKIVVSMLVPDQFDEFTKYETDGVVRDKKHEGIYRFPNIEVDDSHFILLTTFRFSSGVKVGDTLLIEPIFRLREIILNDLISRYSQFGSRIGIVRF